MSLRNGNVILELNLKLLTRLLSHPAVFLGIGVPKICSKFTREHPCRGMISIKMPCNVIELAHQYGCSPANLLHIFRTTLHKDTYGELLPDLMMMMMMMMMVNCFCGMVDRQKAFSLVSSRDHCQRFSPLRISDTLRAGIEPAQNLSSGLVE